MGKTVTNLVANPAVALTAWSGLSGVQIKATAVYVTEGETFTSEVAVMEERFPERTLRGLVVLTPTALYDVSAGATAGLELTT